MRLTLPISITAVYNTGQYRQRIGSPFNAIALLYKVHLNCMYWSLETIQIVLLDLSQCLGASVYI